MPVRGKQTDNPYGLTHREVELVRAWVKTGSKKGAARVLGLSCATVSDYSKNIYFKLSVKKLSSMVLRAERAGLLQGVEV